MLDILKTAALFTSFAAAVAAVGIGGMTIASVVIPHVAGVAAHAPETLSVLARIAG